MPSLRRSALLLAYPVVWAFSTASFWLAGSSSDALGFTLLHLYFLHPVAILAVSFAAAFRVTSLRRLTVIPFALALGYLLCDFLTFRLANMISFSQWTSPEWIMLPVGIALSLFGLILGRVAGRLVSRNR